MMPSRPRRRRWLAWLPLILVPGLLVAAVVAPPLLRRATCPSPPVPVEALAPSTQGALVGHLPATIPGFDAEYPQSVTPDDIIDGPEHLGTGYRYGYLGVYVHPDAHIDVHVLRFDTPSRARAFERSQIRELCERGHRTRDPAGVPEARGIAVRTHESSRVRISFIRGPVDYVVDFFGPGVSADLRDDVTRSVLRLARQS